MRGRYRYSLLAAAAAMAATFPGNAAHATAGEAPPTLVAESTIAGHSVSTLVQAADWQPLKAGWQTRFHLETAPQERTVIHVRWRSPTFMLSPGKSVFRTQVTYKAQGAPGARVRNTDSFRICFAKSGDCTPWWVAGAAGSPFPNGFITYDVTGWERSPWTGHKARAYFQWRFIWRQDNAAYSDVTLLVQL
jgi:hypothetical protein